jgi:ParB-like chromosome segregation protein Spo0J
MNKFTTTKIMVPIERVVPNPWNPNIQSKEMFEKGINSVKETGMLGSILVRETGGCYQILDGEHRWKYLQELKYTEIPVETMGEISDDLAMALTVRLNNLRGKDDIEKRAKIFEQLSEGQLQLMPFTEEEIKNEKELFKFDFSKYDRPEGEIEEKEKFRIIIIDVHEEEYKLWQFLKKHAEKDRGKTELQLFMEMCDYYSSLHFGRDAKSKVQEF